MTSKQNIVSEPQVVARFAGVFYLIIIVLGLWSELAVRSALIVPGDALATAANITGAAALFRLGIAADSIMVIADITLAVLLFALLRPVGPLLALLAMIFRLAQATVIAGNLLNQQSALLIIGQGSPESAEMATLALDLHSYGYDLGLIFFGVNSLLTGWLLWRSGFLPRWLGAGVAAAGMVYLSGSYLRFLDPGLSEAFQPAYFVPVLAETAFCLWLLVMGVDGEKWRAWDGAERF